MALRLQSSFFLAVLIQHLLVLLQVLVAIVTFFSLFSLCSLQLLLFQLYSLILLSPFFSQFFSKTSADVICSLCVVIKFYVIRIDKTFTSRHRPVQNTIEIDFTLPEARVVKMKNWICHRYAYFRSRSLEYCCKF